ncbi:VOC family protein [Flavitalea antarctica]
MIGCVSSWRSTPEKELFNSRLPGDGFGIYSATVMVKNLDSTRNYYINILGFKMPEKFEKRIYEGTLMAYVAFPDFSYIELLSFKDTALIEKKTFFLLLHSLTSMKVAGSNVES